MAKIFMTEIGEQGTLDPFQKRLHSLQKMNEAEDKTQNLTTRETAL